MFILVLFLVNHPFLKTVVTPLRFVFLFDTHAAHHHNTHNTNQQAAAPPPNSTSNLMEPPALSDSSPPLLPIGRVCGGEQSAINPILYSSS